MLDRVTARIVDGLPHDQVKGLDYAREAPLIYCRVGLRNWQAFADAQIASVTPRGNSLFWDTTSLQVGTRIGSAYELTSTYDPSLFGPVSGQPHVKGRRPFRNVAIANSDSGAFAYTHSAINEAYRAVQELP